MIKVGDKVTLKSLDLSHRWAQKEGHGLAERINNKYFYTVISAGKNSCRVGTDEYEFFYKFEDIVEHVTIDSNPEYFL